MGFLSGLLGLSDDKNKVKSFLDAGAVIIDVRTPSEFQGGHVAGSRNIPLNEISASVDELKALNKPLVLCCASGMRSKKATSTLSSAGIECLNGGSWTQVNSLV